MKGGDTRMEFYEMPLFIKIFTNNLEASKKWYEEKLGFTTVYDFPNPNGAVIMSHLRREKCQDFMLIAGEFEYQKDSHIIVNLAVKNIEQIANHFSSNEIMHPLTKQPWNAKELTICTLEGLQITLSEQQEKNLNFDEVMGQC